MAAHGKNQRSRAARAGSRAWLLAACGIVAPLAAHAQSVEELSRLSIEELANLQVTSAARRPEPLSRAAAAIYVITAEDIRRSGATSLPEALRLAPNLEVARLNTSTHAITARGFNSAETSNKLLVLVDGRSVYSPLAATVFWDSVDVSLPDIERIEVISGPGGTLWGANAVNGVINVVTKHTRDTQGILVDAGAGNREVNGTVRQGGTLGENASYRIYASRFDRASSPPANPADISEDAFSGTQGGFRFDAAAGRDSYTLQGDLFRNRSNLLSTDLLGGNLLGRWTRQIDEGSSVQLQAYYDAKHRESFLADDSVHTYDVQGQHNLRFEGDHQFVWGGEYRVWRSTFESKNIFQFPDPKATLSVASLFAQGEIALGPALRLTLGTKLERSNYTGLDILPNLRLAWQAAEGHLLWAAVSRAVRTPSRIDRELAAPGILAESSNFKPEELTAYEIGYRGSPAPNTTVSISAFYNVYDDLRTTTPSQPATAANPLGLPFVLTNELEGTTYGVEAWGTYGIADWWRIRAGYNLLKRDFNLKSPVIDITDPPSSGQDPTYQARLQSEMDLTPDSWLDVTLRRVGRVRPSMVPQYTELDAHVGWRIHPSLELSLHGTNLLDNRHVEVIDLGSGPVRMVGRTIFAKIRAGF